MNKKLMNASKQAYNLQENYENCLDCGEAIFNPICPNCLTSEFEQWINKYSKLKKSVFKIIHKFLRAHDKSNGYSRQCIICNNKTAYLCPYCFTEFLLSTLKTSKANDETLKEFLQLFNFDFDHTGYYKEGENLGIF